MSINNYKDICIYRNFIDADTYLIIIYYYKTKMFYRVSLTSKEFAKITTQYKLEQLGKIFEVCFEENSGYTIDIDRDDSTLILFFKCIERINVYEWEILCIEQTSYIENTVKNFLCNYRKTFDPCDVIAKEMFDTCTNDLLDMTNNFFKNLAKEREAISLIYEYMQKNTIHQILSKENISSTQSKEGTSQTPNTNENNKSDNEDVLSDSYCKDSKKDPHQNFLAKRNNRISKKKNKKKLCNEESEEENSGVTEVIKNSKKNKKASNEESAEENSDTLEVIKNSKKNKKKFTDDE